MAVPLHYRLLRPLLCATGHYQLKFSQLSLPESFRSSLFRNVLVVTVVPVVKTDANPAQFNLEVSM